jgi:hypothetical protein
VAGHPDRHGARCPYCREPLYEKSVAVREVDAEGGQCATHPRNAALRACKRCGNFYCAVCRSRWHGQMLCLACLERALETREQAPEEVRSHFRQALWAVICGVGGWAMAVAGFILAAVGLEAGPTSPTFMLGVAGLLVFLASPAFIVPGLGLGLTAVRARGDHLILATAGLILSALQAGAFIGIFCLSVWRN